MKVNRVITSLAALAALIVLPLYAWKVQHKLDYTDFDVYYRAGLRANQGLWEQIYNQADGASPYRYAPVFLPFFALLALLPHDAAKLLWYFIQFGALVTSFELLSRAARLIPSIRHKGLERSTAALSLFFVLRFWLDCFMIGQVSSIIFVSFVVGLMGWTLGRTFWASLGLFLPTTFKIGPGILLGLLTLQRPARFRASMGWLGFLGLATFSLTALWLGSLATTRNLWEAWIRTVRTDSSYFDASHYGSQSIKSALLRLANQGTITLDLAGDLYLICLLAGTVFVLLFWLFRRPSGFLGRGLFFSLGIFAYLWFMPETFKYTLTALAIPALFLQGGLLHTLLPMAERRLTLGAFAVGALFLTLAGKDLMSDALFFGLQKASFPLLATLALGFATLVLSCRFSVPSPFLVSLRAVFVARRPGPWSRDPSREGDLESTFILPLPLAFGQDFDSSLIIELLRGASSLFSETIVCTFGDFALREHPSASKIQALLPGSLRWIESPSPHPTRAAALRFAFLESRGRTISVAHAEQPTRIDFYERALKLIQEGASLVRANRRHQDSQFEIPVKLLRLVNGRHRLGLLFNRLVRFLLPVTVTDTHSGSYSMTRAFALRAFSAQSSLGFLFDLELSLTAHAQGLSERDLPARLLLATEKRPRRIAAEMISILIGLPGLAHRYRAGLYAAPAPIAPDALSADDWGLSPGVNEGILDLVQRGLVRRVSLMANCEYLTHRLKDLLAAQTRDPRIQLGLHFNLTYGDQQPFGHSTPGRFLLQSFFCRFGARRKRWEIIREELRLQLAQLERVGVKAQFFDAHQHMHLVPGMIDEVAGTLKDAGIRQVRLPYDPALWLTPRMPISLLAWLASGKLKRHGFESLDCFYPFPEHFADPALFRSKLTRFARSEVIVHPASFNDIGTLKFSDSLREARVTEFLAIRMLGFLA